jgi:glycerol dehydrogenase-like iron-containing ADH family enzyme
LGLPLTLRGLGFVKNEKNLVRLAEEICKKESNVHRLPFPVNKDMVHQALLEANTRGEGIEEEN